MTVLSVLLFFVGAVFLILGWRWQYPPNTELLTAMKGMVHLKSEIHKLEEDMLSLNERLENKLFQPIAQDQFLSAYCKHNTLVNQEDIDRKDNGDNSDDKDTSDSGDVLPDKYRQVLELAEYDLTVREISEKLEMSQDAVMMVIRTHQRGEKAIKLMMK